jgi:hypothetical protein
MSARPNTWTRSTDVAVPNQYMPLRRTTRESSLSCRGPFWVVGCDREAVTNLRIQHGSSFNYFKGLVLAETEGFEPSIGLYNPITV